MDKAFQALIFLVLSLILIPLVISQEFTFPQNSVSQLRHKVTVGGGIPSASASCNITAYNSTQVIIDDELMTNNINYFNFTLNETHTGIKGLYHYTVSCTQGELNDSVALTYLVNLGGVEPNQERTDTVSRSIYIMLIIGVLLFVGFIFIKGKFPLKSTLLLLSLMFVLIGVNLLFVDIQDVIINSSLEGFFSSLTAISFYIFYAIGFSIFFIWVVTIIINVIEKRTQSKLKRLDG